MAFRSIVPAIILVALLLINSAHVGWTLTGIILGVELVIWTVVLWHRKNCSMQSVEIDWSKRVIRLHQIQRTDRDLLGPRDTALALGFNQVQDVTLTSQNPYSPSGICIIAEPFNASTGAFFGDWKGLCERLQRIADLTPKPTLKERLKHGEVSNTAIVLVMIGVVAMFLVILFAWP